MTTNANAEKEAIHINTRDENGVTQSLDAVTERAILDASDKLKQAFSTPPANAGEKIETPREGWWRIILPSGEATNGVVVRESVHFLTSGGTAYRYPNEDVQFIAPIPPASESAARDEAMLNLLSASKNCGGGDLYIQDYGRTCHCPFHTRKGGVTRDQMACSENHSTACNEMWNAIKSGTHAVKRDEVLIGWLKEYIDRALSLLAEAKGTK